MRSRGAIKNAVGFTSGCARFGREGDESGSRRDVEFLRQCFLHDVEDGILDEVLTNTSKLGQPKTSHFTLKTESEQLHVEE